MNTALATCHTQVITVHTSVRRVTVRDVCVVSRMKAAKLMV